MSIFPERLLSAIEMRGVTQRWLAARTGITEATISRYITKERTPMAFEVVASVAAALNVSTDYLLGNVNSPYPKEDLGGEELVLLAAYNRATLDDRGVLWALLNKYLTPAEKEGLQSLEQNKQIG